MRDKWEIILETGEKSHNIERETTQRCSFKIGGPVRNQHWCKAIVNYVSYEKQAQNINEQAHHWRKEQVIAHKLTYFNVLINKSNSSLLLAIYIILISNYGKNTVEWGN